MGLFFLLRKLEFDLLLRAFFSLFLSFFFVSASYLLSSWISSSLRNFRCFFVTTIAVTRLSPVSWACCHVRDVMVGGMAP
jgi:hypothetical protein